MTDIGIRVKTGQSFISTFSVTQFQTGAAAEISFTEFEPSFQSCYGSSVTYAIVNQSPAGLLTYPASSCGSNPQCNKIEVDTLNPGTVTFSIQVFTTPAAPSSYVHATTATITINDASAVQDNSAFQYPTMQGTASPLVVNVDETNSQGVYAMSAVTYISTSQAADTYSISSSGTSDIGVSGISAVTFAAGTVSF